MRTLLATLITALCAAPGAIMAVTQAADQTAVDTGASPAVAKPKTFALIASVGDTFSVVTEEESIGSRLRGYKRDTAKVPDNQLNVLALQSLDKVVEQINPGSKRIYMSMDTSKLAESHPVDREARMISDVQARMGAIPAKQREEWDLILVATPSLVRDNLNGMATKLQGFGVFTQPLEGNSFSFPNDTNFPTSSPHTPYHFSDQQREDAITPEGKPIHTKLYVAPFSYIKVWILDPKTLAVLDEQKQYVNQKIADPQSGSLELNHSISKEFMAKQILAVIDKSTSEAVLKSEQRARRGSVEVGPIKERKD